MKHSKYAYLSLLLLVLVTSCAPSAPPAPTELETEAAATPAPPTAAADSSPWEVVLEINVEQPTRMAAFLDARFGVTGGAGDPGKVHYTTDGGQTWTLADTSGG